MNEEVEVLEIEGFEDKNEVEILTVEEKKKGIFTRGQKIFIVIALIIIVLGLFFAFTLYGSWPGFRNYIITNNKSLAGLLYNDYTINNQLSNNYLKEPLANVDSSKITFDKGMITNKYDELILNHNSDKDYQVIEINENGIKGQMVAIYNPGILSLAKVNASNLDNYVVALNATSGGLITNNGKIIENNTRKNVGGGTIGIDSAGRLILGKYSEEEAKKLAFSTDYGPFLIVNGEIAEVYGNGGWPNNAKSIIAQRQDGIILLIHLQDFNFLTGSKGADMNDVINLLISFGAYNAANLPGGDESFLYARELNNSYSLKGQNVYSFVIKK